MLKRFPRRIFFSYLFFSSSARALLPEHDALFSLNLTDMPSYNSVPENYELTNVIIIHRHGDRSQINKGTGTKLKEFGAIDYMWKSKMPQPETLQRLAAVANVSTDKQQSQDIYDARDTYAYPYGMLTEVGAHQLITLGKILRNNYVGTFLSSPLLKTELSLRSTNYCRTKLSLRGLLVGLYDLSPGDTLEDPSDMEARPREKETLYAHSDRKPCPSLTNRRNEIFANNYIAKNFPNFIEFESRIASLIGYSGDIDWLAAREVLICRYSHQMPMPESVTLEDIQTLDKFAGWVMKYQYDDVTLNRFAVGRLFNDILNNINLSLSGASPHKLSVFSTHDSTIMAVLSALGINNGIFPLYASNIIIELVKEKQSEERFVRVLYNMKEMQIPACTNSNSNSNSNNLSNSKYWCSSDSFFTLLKSFVLDDYSKQCQAEPHGDEHLVIDIFASSRV